MSRRLLKSASVAPRGPQLSRSVRRTDTSMNRWGIPDWLETAVQLRDKQCVYCRVSLIGLRDASGPRGSVATWEHIINDAEIITLANIARCCASCNSSKGTKKLTAWLESEYCRRRGIGPDTVADVVREALRHGA